MATEGVSTRFRVAECAAVAATGVLHVLWLVAIGGGGGDVGVIGAAWLLYLAWRVRRDRTVLARWGLRREGLRPAAVAAAALLLAGAGVIAAIAAARGTLRWNAHMLPLFALYPLWGWLQQLLMFGVFLTNLEELAPPRRALAIGATILLFGLVHAPFWGLVAGTVALAAALTPLWLRWRNLWPLGLVHGWLGVTAIVTSRPPGISRVSKRPSASVSPIARGGRTESPPAPSRPPPRIAVTAAPATGSPDPDAVATTASARPRSSRASITPSAAGQRRESKAETRPAARTSRWAFSVSDRSSVTRPSASVVPSGDVSEPASATVAPATGAPSSAATTRTATVVGMSAAVAAPAAQRRMSPSIRERSMPRS